MTDDCSKPTGDDGEIEALGGLLAKATWPDPEPDRLDRLRQHWYRARRRARWASGSARAVAALLLAGTVGLVGVGTVARVPSADRVKPLKNPIARAAARQTPSPASAAKDAAELASTTSRPANVYETAFLVARRRPFVRQRTTGAVEARPKPDPDLPGDPYLLVELVRLERDPPRQRRFIVRLIELGTPDAVRLYLELVGSTDEARIALDALGEVALPPVEAFFAALAVPNVEHRLAAARVLGRIDGPLVARRLGEMVDADYCRREALVALMSIDADHARRMVDERRHDPDVMPVIHAVEVQLKSL